MLSAAALLYSSCIVKRSKLLEDFPRSGSNLSDSNVVALAVLSWK
jgi:hypothetical protein